jgi:capsular exopolysaccharide synthesis family protein
VHEVFGGSNRVGLVHFLTQGTAPEEVVFETRIPNLWIAPSGPLPPNPSELIASDRMREFLDWARGQFDLVIFDSAPALAVTDAILLGKLTDGVVLCLRAGYVQRRDAQGCRDRLEQAGVRLLGAVLNCYRGLDGSYRSRYSRDYAEEAYGVAEATSGRAAAL